MEIQHPTSHISLRDENSLESALYAPQQDHFYRKEECPKALAGSYLFHLIKAHAFVDGNKRMAMMATYLFIRENMYSSEWDRLTSAFLESFVPDLCLDIASNKIQLKKEVQNILVEELAKFNLKQKRRALGKAL